MLLRFLLRPAVLASVAVHGAAVAAAYMAVEGRPAALREPVVVSTLAADLPDLDEPAAPTESPDDDRPPEAVAVREASAVEALPVPELLELPSALPAAESTVVGLGSSGGADLGLRTNRLRPDRAAGTAASPAVAAGPAGESGVSRRGSGVSRWSIAHPSNPSPVYPPDALSRGLEGTVWLQFTVRVDGTLAGLSIERSSGVASLDEAAYSAVAAWRYEPKLVDGVAVEEALRVPVRFRLTPR